jgi:hypothetical protein
MPKTPTPWTVGAQTTTQYATSVNQTGEAMFGRPVIRTDQFGVHVISPQTVLTGNSSVVVHAVSLTTAHF